MVSYSFKKDWGGFIRLLFQQSERSFCFYYLYFVFIGGKPFLPLRILFAVFKSYQRGSKQNLPVKLQNSIAN